MPENTQLLRRISTMVSVILGIAVVWYLDMLGVYDAIAAVDWTMTADAGRQWISGLAMNVGPLTHRIGTDPMAMVVTVVAFQAVIAMAFVVVRVLRFR